MTDQISTWNFERYAQLGFPQKKDFVHKVSFRVNTLFFTDKHVITALKNKGAKITKIPFLHHAYEFEADFPLSTSIEYLSGAIYIQESPAQIPGEIISKYIFTNKLTLENLRVLDMCAAPGGKTVQLAQVMENTGTLVANDISKERVQKLRHNIERMQVGNCKILNVDGQNITETFNIILLDAPCSGNFTQASNWFRTKEDINNRQKLQRALIESAISKLKPGGLLVYSTCSLEPEENEENVMYAIERGMTLIPTHVPIGHRGLTQETKDCIRIWPTQDTLPGFFIAVLQK